MRVERFKDYSIKNDTMSQDFIIAMQGSVNESDNEENYKSTQSKIIADLKLNGGLVMTFGVGMTALYPIVDKLMKNLGVSSIEITTENIVMLTIAAVSITYLEERKFKDENEESLLTKDAKSLLEELKMRGIGNGIVKKLMKVLSSIKNIFYTIAKHLGVGAIKIIDMFAYTSLLLPILNGLLYVIGKYELNLESLVENFIGLAMGVGTIIAKHGVAEIVDRIKNKFKLSKKEVTDEIKTPVAIQRFSDFGDGKSETEGELINEQ